MSLTNYPNGITSFGVPVIGSGLIPPMIDNSKEILYYFVDGRNGSDSNRGDTPSEPLATIEAAVSLINTPIDWAASPWAPRQVIVIAPGVYAENLTELPYGATLVGLGSAWDINGEYGVTIKPASGSPVDCTSIINAWIQNICFAAPDTSVIFQADNLNRNTIIDCFFAGLPGASPTTTRGLEVVKDMTGTRVLRCHFLQIKTAIYLVADNANQKQITGDLIEDCFISGGDTAGIYFDANCVPSNTIINRCNIGGGGTTLALGLDDNAASVHVYNTNFEATANDPSSGNYNNCYLNGTLLT